MIKKLSKLLTSKNIIEKILWQYLYGKEEKLPQKVKQNKVNPTEITLTIDGKTLTNSEESLEQYLFILEDLQRANLLSEKKNSVKNYSITSKVSSLLH